MNVGVVAAAVAFSLWGFFPLYFRLLPEAPPFEVLANRIVWSLLLSANWLAYIWAVSNGHVIDASLGYFITPLVNVALGYTILGERPRHAQWVALVFACAGVVWLAFGAGSWPWIGLVIGLSFGAYGLPRKIAVIGALEGLTLETLILAPAAALAMAWWWGGSPTSFPAPDLPTNAWLIGLGPATTVPLLLFTVAARRLPLSTLGLFQYLSPTIQFVLGVWLFAEPFTLSRFAGFALIWAALALYTLDSWRVARRISPPRAPAPPR